MVGPATSITGPVVPLCLRPTLWGLWSTLIVLSMLVASSGRGEAQRLLIDNPGFEQGSAQWLLKPNSETADIAPDRNFSHSGQTSLRLSAVTADNPSAAQLVGHVQGLATYRLAARVRAAEGSRAVAAVRVEFYDGSNKNISVWRQQLHTSEDGTWQTIEQTANAEAGAVSAVVILRLLGPGELWFDDVEFTVVSLAPALLALPNDLVVTAEGVDSVSFDLQLSEAIVGAAQFEFFINSPHLDRPLAADFHLDQANDRVFGVLLNVPKLKPGWYTLDIVRSDTGQRGWANLVAVPADSHPQTVRSDGVLLVEGAPFFPICACATDSTDFNTLGTLGFNTVELPPTDDLDRLGQLLDRADEHHLQAIVPLYGSLDDSATLAEWAKKVERFSDHPALLAWKLMHLPTVHPNWRKPAIEAFLRLKQANSSKPLLVGICNSVQYRRWSDFLDWLEVICPLPNDTGAPPVAELTGQAIADAHPGQMLHTTLPLATNCGLSDRDMQNEYRTAIYLALIAGARGIGWRGPSSATDEGELLGQINAEATQIGQALVGGQTAQVAYSTDRLRCHAVKYGGAIFTVVANNTDQRIVARIQLPEAATAARLLYGDNASDGSYTPLRLSRNGRVVTFALSGGQCNTIVSTLMTGDTEY